LESSDDGEHGGDNADEEEHRKKIGAEITSIKVDIDDSVNYD